MEDKMEISVAEASEVDISPEQEAVIITERIKANGRAAVSAVCNIGKDLRRMKAENLFVHLGYQNFEDYAEKEFAIKKRQAYLYISVYEKLGEEFLQSNAQLGITRLSLLSSANPEDRAEIMENNDVAGMTTKELEELIGKYKSQGEQLSMFEEENKNLKEASESDRKERESLEERVQSLEWELRDKLSAIAELEENVKELESLTQDVQVAEKEVIREVIKEVPDTKTKEKLDKKTQELIRSNLEREQVKKELSAANAEKALQEQTISRMKKEIEELKKAAAKPAESPDKSCFKSAYASAYKEITGLIELIRTAGEGKSVFIERTEALIKTLTEKLEEVKE